MAAASSSSSSSSSRSPHPSSSCCRSFLIASAASVFIFITLSLFFFLPTTINIIHRRPHPPPAAAATDIAPKTQQLLPFLLQERPSLRTSIWIPPSRSAMAIVPPQRPSTAKTPPLTCRPGRRCARQPSPPPPSQSPSPSPSPPPRRHHRTLPPALSLCNSTGQAQLCAAELVLYRQRATRKGRATLEDLTAHVTSRALEAVNATYSDGAAMVKAGTRSAVLQDCMELLDGARDELTQVMGRLAEMRRRRMRKAGGELQFRAAAMDVRAWLSGAEAEQASCWDEFEEGAGGDATSVERRLRAAGDRIEPLLSIALSFAQALQEAGPSAIYALPSSSKHTKQLVVGRPALSPSRAGGPPSGAASIPPPPPLR